MKREGSLEQMRYADFEMPQTKARRSVHKDAEQKRRDILKNCFDELRATLLVPSDLTISKVAVLQKGTLFLSIACKVIKEQRDQV